MIKQLQVFKLETDSILKNHGMRCHTYPLVLSPQLLTCLRRCTSLGISLHESKDVVQKEYCIMYSTAYSS